MYQKIAAHNNKARRAIGKTLLALIPLNQGKLRQTLTVLENSIAADKMEQVSGFPNAIKYLVKSFVHLHLDEYTLALKACETAINTLPPTRPHKIFEIRWSGYYSSILGALKRFDKIDEIDRRIKKELNEADDDERYYYSRPLGWLEIARGNPEAAIPYLEKAVKEIPYYTNYQSIFLDHHLLGKANLESGRFDEAVQAFEKALNAHDMLRVYHGISMAKTHYFLGLAYEKQGQYENALKKYNQFLDIWKHADPEINEIKTAKEKVTELKAIMNR